MNELARKLNSVLDGTTAGSLLSEMGRRLYFPRGIVAQSAEAKRQPNRINATVGIAARGGEPLFLPSIRDQIPALKPEQIFSYAPTAGIQELRELWLEEIREKNPSLSGKSTSLPVVVSGLTQGLSLLADLFVDPGDTVVVPDLYWGNYRLIFEVRRQAQLKTFPLFDEKRELNVEALQRTLDSEQGDKIILILNFPNNPTGYSPTGEEAKRLLDHVGEAARTGKRIILVLDDAYFGLFYEQAVYPQSLFAEAADLDDNLLAVKIDGATKENLVWGFRLGFITMACSGLEQAHYEAITGKVMGALRSSVSSASRIGQSLVLEAMKSPDYRVQRRRIFELLKARYLRSKELLETLQEPLTVLPFNSGYFLSFDTGRLSAETLRRTLLYERGIATISIQDRYLRVAYSSVDIDQLQDLYRGVYRAASDQARTGLP